MENGLKHTTLCVLGGEPHDQRRAAGRDQTYLLCAPLTFKPRCCRELPDIVQTTVIQHVYGEVDVFHFEYVRPGVGGESRELLANGEEDVNRGVVFFLDASSHDIDVRSVFKSCIKPEARQSYISGGKGITNRDPTPSSSSMRSHQGLHAVFRDCFPRDFSRWT